MPQPTCNSIGMRHPPPGSSSESDSDESSSTTDDSSSSIDTDFASPRTLRKRKHANEEIRLPRLVIRRAASETRSSPRTPSRSVKKTVDDNHVPKSPLRRHRIDGCDADTINESPRVLDSSRENTAVGWLLSPEDTPHNGSSVSVADVLITKKNTGENSQNKKSSVFPSTSRDPQRLLNCITPNKTIGFPCTECPTVCLNMIGKIQHMLFQHSILFCAKCEKPAGKNDDVLSHQCDELADDKEPESRLILRTFCYICSWQPHFSTYHSFRAHHRTMHSQLKDAILYACVVCGNGNRLYGHAHSLSYHYKKEHPNSEQAINLYPYASRFSTSGLSEADKSLVPGDEDKLSLTI